MSKKCAACGLVNFRDALFCKRCGQRLAASDDKQTATGNAPVASDRQNLRPGLILLGIMLLLMSLIFGFVGILDQRKTSRCSATTEGLLDQKFWVETRKQLGIPVSESYEVSYTFQVQGRNYEGSDRLSTKPVKQQVTVFYDPADPTHNLIEPEPFSPWMILVTLGVGGLGISFFVWGKLKK